METPWNRAPSAEIKMSVNAIGGEANWDTLFVLQKLINLPKQAPGHFVRRFPYQSAPQPLQLWRHLAKSRVIEIRKIMKDCIIDACWSATHKNSVEMDGSSTRLAHFLSLRSHTNRGRRNGKVGLIVDLLDIGNWRDSRDMIVDTFRTVACRIELSARVGVINEKRNRNQKFEILKVKLARTPWVQQLFPRLAGATAPLQFSSFCVSGRWDFNCWKTPTREER